MATAIPVPQQQTPPQPGAQPQQAAPVTPQQAQPNPKVQQAAQTLTKAATTLPQMVGQQVQQHDQMAKIRMQHVITTVANSHIADTAARSKVQQLDSIKKQIDQHWQEAQALPEDDPQKMGKIQYLAMLHKQVVGEIVQQAQTIKQHQQITQAILAEPKNRKILAKAVGYDEKAANTPERQMMVQALQQHQQAIQQQAQQPQQEQQPPQMSKGKQIAEGVFGAAFPQVGDQKAYQQRQQLEMDSKRAEIDQKEAQAGAQEPWQAKQQDTQARLEERSQESQNKLAEQAKESNAKLEQAKAIQQSTDEFRKATLQFKKDQEAWKENPKNPELQIKMHDSQSKALAAQASMLRAKSAASAVGDTNSPALIDQIGTGKIAPDRLGYLLARNPTLLNQVVAKYPDFDSSKVAAYPKVYADFTSTKSGTAGGAINAGATALSHLKELQKMNTAESHIYGTPDYTAYKNKVDTLATELAKFYGDATIPAINSIKSTLMSTMPGNRDAAIRTQVQSMGDKLDNYEQSWKNAAPSKAYEAPMPNISEKAKKARAALDPAYAQRKAGATPHTHVFSLEAWKKANPSGDVSAAKSAAEQQGYQVVP